MVFDEIESEQDSRTHMMCWLPNVTYDAVESCVFLLVACSLGALCVLHTWMAKPWHVWYKYDTYD